MQPDLTYSTNGTNERTNEGTNEGSYITEPFPPSPPPVHDKASLPCFLFLFVLPAMALALTLLCSSEKKGEERRVEGIWQRETEEEIYKAMWRQCEGHVKTVGFINYDSGRLKTIYKTVGRQCEGHDQLTFFFPDGIGPNGDIAWKTTCDLDSCFEISCFFVCLFVYFYFFTFFFLFCESVVALQLFLDWYRFGKVDFGNAYRQGSVLSYVSAWGIRLWIVPRGQWHRSSVLAA